MAIDIDELTVSQFHHILLVQNNLTAITDLVSAYLARISQYNPTLKALISINPNALEIARVKDLETTKILRSQNERERNLSNSDARFRLPSPFPPLHGIPIILKDTYSTADLPITSGCTALKTLQTNSDAFVVQKLRSAGAIILAKANLHEFSLQGLSHSSLGGQTLNPYDPTRTPGGSSGGTAAALAANMSLLGCGGDTMNSLRSPASACCAVGFRPTRGQVSRYGIMGVSETQDVVGPMGRTVGDVRVLFDVMKGEDKRDSITVDSRRTTVFSGLGSLRIGVLDAYFGGESYTTTPTSPSESETVKQTILETLSKVQAERPAITEVIHLLNCLSTTKDWNWDPFFLLKEADVQSYEFRSVLNDFLQSPLVGDTPHKTLESIAASNDYARSSVTNVFFNALQPDKYSLESPDYRSRLEKIEQLKCSVQECFEEHELDVLVYPHQKQLVVQVGESEQKGRNGILAALTGRPAVCIPAGFSPPTQTASHGIPIGMELMGKPWQDDALLDIAEIFESILKTRKQPDMTWISNMS